MHGIEEIFCNECIKAVISGWIALMDTPATTVLSQTKYGKRDTPTNITLGLDAIPEINIHKRIEDFDPHAIFITEELGKNAKARWPDESDPNRQPLMFFSDPTDRSAQLEQFLKELSEKDKTTKVGELMAKNDCIGIWESKFGAPATITGSTTSITCVRKGTVIFSVILNYISRMMVVATSANIYCINLPDYTDANLDVINFSFVVKNGRILSFPSAKETCVATDDYLRFVTFLGKSGYKENFDDSMIFVEEAERFLHYKMPGGPSRPLYLSELQKGSGPLGFILANGEKIIEWVHWLSFVKFAKNIQGGPALKMFEIAIERPWIKQGVLMSTSIPYSIFVDGDEGTYIDISRLKNFDNPSKYRSMLLVTPHDNDRIICIMRQHEYREIILV